MDGPRHERWESGRRPYGAGLGAALKPRLAGLPPHGPPSLTQSAAEVTHRRNPYLSRQQLMHNRLSGAFQVHGSGRSPSQSLWFPCGAIHFIHIDQQSSSTSRRTDTPCSCMSIRVAQTCGRKMCDFADPRFRGRTSPALEWAFLGSGAAFYDQPARGSLRKRATSSASPLEVTAATPEHIGACRAGMVPAQRREPCGCRTISPSPRTMPSIWPAR